jgi:hypothetical protein
MARSAIRCSSGRIFEIGKPGAGLVVGQFGKAEIPQPRCPRLALQVAHEGRGLALGDVNKPGAMVRQHFLGEEGLQLLKPCFRSNGKIEIHVASRARAIF